MSILLLFLLGIGLSFDTFAVSVSCGIVDEKIRFWQAVRIALFFAVFQAVMPIIGWLLGSSFKVYVSSLDHWIAFTLLSIIGLKMIYESLQKVEDDCFDPHDLKIILTLSFATTIDALVVGVGYAMISVNFILLPVIIGLVTFLVAMMGMFFGKKIGNRFGKRVEIAGGLILISIGVKILAEHLNWL
jgi:manganese efflux pump family protein